MWNTAGWEDICYEAYEYDFCFQGRHWLSSYMAMATQGTQKRNTMGSRLDGDKPKYQKAKEMEKANQEDQGLDISFFKPIWHIQNFE